MTKHEEDIIGGLNMTGQISDEAYKQIMIHAQEETEIDDVLADIREQIHNAKVPKNQMSFFRDGINYALNIIDKYRESEVKPNDDNNPQS